jgi:hypothetical protein
LDERLHKLLARHGIGARRQVEAWIRDGRVLVNGRPAEIGQGGVSVMSDCPSCGELVGEPACCREIEVGGVRTEAVGRDVVFDAIMAAAGLASAGAPVAPCCAPAPFTGTLVTGPGCG